MKKFTLKNKIGFVLIFAFMIVPLIYLMYKTIAHSPFWWNMEMLGVIAGALLIAYLISDEI